MLLAAFEEAYRRLYSRVIPGVEVEVLSWVLLLSGPAPPTADVTAPAEPPPSYPEPARRRAGVRPGQRRVHRGRDPRARRRCVPAR